LNWKEHIDRKRKQIDLKTQEINWLIGKKSHLSIKNKLPIYKAAIKPMWSYGIELWGCASKSNSHHAEITMQNRAVGCASESNSHHAEITMQNRAVGLCQQVQQSSCRDHNAK